MINYNSELISKSFFGWFFNFLFFIFFRHSKNTSCQQILFIASLQNALKTRPYRIFEDWSIWVINRMWSQRKLRYVLHHHRIVAVSSFLNTCEVHLEFIRTATIIMEMLRQIKIIPSRVSPGNDILIYFNFKHLRKPFSIKISHRRQWTHRRILSWRCFHQHHHQHS